MLLVIVLIYGRYFKSSSFISCNNHFQAFIGKHNWFYIIYTIFSWLMYNLEPPCYLSFTSLLVFSFPNVSDSFTCRNTDFNAYDLLNTIVLFMKCVENVFLLVFFFSSSRGL